MKAAKRKELVNELRSAHFSMGFEKQKFDSEYKQEYIEYPQQFGLETKDLRKTNFELGQDNSQEFYQSMMKSNFKKPEQVQVAQLSKETVKDLRQHHFNLGSDKPTLLSEAQENYDKKMIDPQAFKDRKAQVNELRRHKHEFGDDQTYFSSMYDQKHNGINNQKLDGQPKSKDEILKQIVELRKTNLVLGNHPTQYQSMQQQCFKPNQQSIPVKYDMNLKKSHFDFGEDQPPYETTCQAAHKDFYKTNSIQPNNMDKMLVKDLRATHFSMGNENPNYQSEALNQYQEKPLPEPQNEHDKQRFYKGYYEQGDPDLKDIYTSSYVADFDKTQQGKKEYLDKGGHIQHWDPNSLRATSFRLGEDPNNWQSEHHGKYNPYPNAQKSKLEAQTQADLRRHHAQLGIDENDWKTEHQATYYDKSGPRVQLSEEMLKDLRKQHFAYGFDKGNYQVSSDKIGQQRGQPAKLDERLAKELRTHHFVEGGYQGDYGTIYREQFIWKDPVDD